jgi:hypothetical protein
MQPIRYFVWRENLLFYWCDMHVCLDIKSILSKVNLFVNLQFG